MLGISAGKSTVTLINKNHSKKKCKKYCTNQQINKILDFNTKKCTTLVNNHAVL